MTYSAGFTRSLVQLVQRERVGLLGLVTPRRGTTAGFSGPPGGLFFRGRGIGLMEFPPPVFLPVVVLSGLFLSMVR